MNKNNPALISLIVLFSISFLAAVYIIVDPSTRKSSTEINTGNAKLMKNVKLPGTKTIGVINIFSPISFSGQSSSPWGMKRDGALYWLDLLKQVEEDDQMKALILRLNTPGGTVAATQEIYNQILKIRKAGKIVVVSMGDLTASGGYYIAAAADYIVANPGTLTGSIGVIMAGIDLSDLFQRFGIRYNVFKSGKYKDAMANYRPMSADEARLFQDMIMDTYWQFFNAVKEGRSLSTEKLKKVADGRLLTASQAKEAGLIDELGDFQQAVEITAQKAELGKNYTLEEVVPDYRSVLGKYLNIMAERVLQNKTEVNLIDNKSLNLINQSYVPLFYMYGI